MDEDERLLEENTARLLQAGMGGAAQPDLARRAATFRRLQQELRARRAPEFPEAALVALGALWCCLAVWLTVQVLQGGAIASSPVAPLLVAWLTLNVALTPVASLVILARRKSHE